MATLKMDSKEYDLDKLGDEAKAKVNSARYCEEKIKQLESDLSVLRTARAAYLQALPALLDDSALIIPQGPGQKMAEESSESTH